MKNTVTITEPEVMESIVANDSRLFWDGWAVVHKKKKVSGGAPASKSAQLIGDSWYHVARYDVTETGWTIPRNIL